MIESVKYVPGHLVQKVPLAASLSTSLCARSHAGACMLWVMRMFNGIQMSSRVLARRP